MKRILLPLIIATSALAQSPDRAISAVQGANTRTKATALLKRAISEQIAPELYPGMAAVFGGTQSLHTNSLDEAIALPTDFSARIARNTKLYLQQEAGLTQVVDPLGGSHYLEYLTSELIQKSWSLIEEVEALGGMTRAIENGVPKLRIEEAAAEKQARIDSGQEVIVGVNRFMTEEAPDFQTREVDNKVVRSKYRNQLRHVQMMTGLCNRFVVVFFK